MSYAKKILGLSALLLILSLFGPWAYAEDHATKDDAVEMVKKGVADIKAKGSSVYADISNPKGPYTKLDLYLVVYGLDGKCLAHGQNPALAGLDLLGLRDADGKPFVLERVELARTHDSFWHAYKYVSPTTHKIANKQSYCEKVDKAIVCGGVYE